MDAPRQTGATVLHNKVPPQWRRLLEFLHHGRFAWMHELSALDHLGQAGELTIIQRPTGEESYKTTKMALLIERVELALN